MKIEKLEEKLIKEIAGVMLPKKINIEKGTVNTRELYVFKQLWDTTTLKFQ